MYIVSLLRFIYKRNSEKLNMLVVLLALIDIHTLIILLLHTHISPIYFLCGVLLGIIKGLIFFLISMIFKYFKEFRQLKKIVFLILIILKLF